MSLPVDNFIFVCCVMKLADLSNWLNTQTEMCKVEVPCAFRNHILAL